MAADLAIAAAMKMCITLGNKFLEQTSTSTHPVNEHESFPGNVGLIA